MRLSELARTTTFRLTALYGLVFAVGAVALLGMIYLQSAVYLTHRVDGILAAEADGFSRAAEPQLAARVGEALALNGDRTSIFGLFAAGGAPIAGNLKVWPAALRVDGPPVEVGPTTSFPANARLIARRLPSGEILAVGRDVNQLREMRAIIASALIWGGASIILIGVACGAALSLAPLHRLRQLQGASHEIAAGDLKRRMPVSGRGDELDMFAGMVNAMMDQVERLMAEVKGAADTIAHDLRTPLTHARAQLYRIQQATPSAGQEVARVITELDEVLDRFRALLRISELEAWGRRAGFAPTDLDDIVRQVLDLYQPLAEAGGVRLERGGGGSAVVEADPKLLFEAVTNLVDNAIKFTPAGGTVTVGLGGAAEAPRIVVRDNGPGIAAAERAAVLQRFYRSERDRLIPGSGLGLSLIAAIVRLHRFELQLSDAAPGLKAEILCQAPRGPLRTAGSPAEKTQ